MLWGANVRHDQSASRFKLEDQKAKRCHKRRREHVTDGKKVVTKVVHVVLQRLNSS